MTHLEARSKRPGAPEMPNKEQDYEMADIDAVAGDTRKTKRTHRRRDRIAAEPVVAKSAATECRIAGLYPTV